MTTEMYYKVQSVQVQVHIICASLFYFFQGSVIRS